MTAEICRLSDGHQAVQPIHRLRNAEQHSENIVGAFEIAYTLIGSDKATNTFYNVSQIPQQGWLFRSCPLHVTTTCNHVV
jgi:hypothetical protein